MTVPADWIGWSRRTPRLSAPPAQSKRSMRLHRAGKASDLTMARPDKSVDHAIGPLACGPTTAISGVGYGRRTLPVAVDPAPLTDVDMAD